MSIRWAIRIRTLAELDASKSVGFESVQLPVDAVMMRDETSFAAERKRLASTGLSFKAFEAPLPRSVQVTEQGFNTYYWTEYLGTALRRISEIGCRTLTWGNGRSRLLPVEGDISTAREHFYQFMFLLCGIAERFDIRVCLEPLGPRRTNFLNSFEELEECLSLINKPNLAMAISPRDLMELGTDEAALLKYGTMIAHVHMEHPVSPDTSVPPHPSDRYDYLPFLRALVTIGYSGVVALPPGSTKETLSYCMHLMEQV
ncbi:MAG: sugar phosphate isomerase/epimerase, partial [Spirochaetales bacterium]